MSVVAVNLKSKRIQSGLKKSELAREIGYNPRTISRLESCNEGPSSDCMFKISHYFGCPIEDIFELKE